jgi:hypothetical protein
MAVKIKNDVMCEAYFTHHKYEKCNKILENMKERDQLGHLSIGRNILLKYILKK